MAEKQKRVIISVTTDLETDQRVHKTALSLSRHGYEVMLTGRLLKQSNKDLTRPYPIKRFRLLFTKSALFYAEYNLRLFFYLLFVRADIFLANDTDTLLANFTAGRIRRKKLVFDAHELFTELPELEGRPRVKKVWKKIEDYIFPKLEYAYTVCSSIAAYYHKQYGLDMKVVRNIPFASVLESIPPMIEKNGKKILLYQGAVNVGRGIEWVIEAMPYLEDCVFYIAGEGDLFDVLQQQVKESGLEHQVVFLGRIPFEKLAGYTRCADLGMCLLANQGLSYYYALPNRIFDFVKAGVPMLVTAFPEMQQIINQYGIGRCIDHYEPEYLATVIHEMLTEPINVQGFTKAQNELTWENESKVLLGLFDGL